MLKPEEELGLKIVALSRMGQLDGANCQGCPRMEEWNCCFKGGEFTIIEERDTIVYDSRIFEFELTACPILYVPDTVWRFADEYHYNETQSVQAPKHGDAPAKNWEATKALKHFTGMIERELMKSPKTGDVN